jgi:hypothetical protein
VPLIFQANQHLGRSHPSSPCEYRWGYRHFCKSQLARSCRRAPSPGSPAPVIRQPNLGCRLLLLKSDFGVGVDALIERVEFWISLDRSLFRLMTYAPPISDY